MWSMKKQASRRRNECSWKQRKYSKEKRQRLCWHYCFTFAKENHNDVDTI